MKVTDQHVCFEIHPGLRGPCLAGTQVSCGRLEALEGNMLTSELELIAHAVCYQGLPIREALIRAFALGADRSSDTPQAPNEELLTDADVDWDEKTPTYYQTSG
jgi:hypothetical protein